MWHHSCDHHLHSPVLRALMASYALCEQAGLRMWEDCKVWIWTELSEKNIWRPTSFFLPCGPVLAFHLRNPNKTRSEIGWLMLNAKNLINPLSAQPHYVGCSVCHLNYALFAKKHPTPKLPQLFNLYWQSFSQRLSFTNETDRPSIPKCSQGWI